MVTDIYDELGAPSILQAVPQPTDITRRITNADVSTKVCIPTTDNMAGSKEDCPIGSTDIRAYDARVAGTVARVVEDEDPDRPRSRSKIERVDRYRDSAIGSHERRGGIRHLRPNGCWKWVP